jgi:hypothetical protein
LVALAQVRIDLLKEPLREHRADHLGCGPSAQAVGEGQGDALGMLGGGALDQELGVRKLDHGSGLPCVAAEAKDGEDKGLVLGITVIGGADLGPEQGLVDGDGQSYEDIVALAAEHRLGAYRQGDQRVT